MQQEQAAHLIYSISIECSAKEDYPKTHAKHPAAQRLGKP